MEQLEAFHKAISNLIKELVREETQGRIEALTNYVEGRLQGFLDTLQSFLQGLRIQAVDAEARSMIEDVKKASQDLKTDYDRLGKAVEEKLKEVFEAFNALSKTADVHGDLLEELTKKLAKLNDAVGAVDKNVKTLYESYAVIADQTNFKITSLESALNVANEKILTQEKTKEDFESRINLLEREFQNVRSENQSLREELQKLREENQALKGKLEKGEKENKELLEKVKDLDQKFLELQRENEVLKRENEALKQQVAERFADVLFRMNDLKGQVLVSLERLTEEIIKANRNAFPTDSPR